MITDFVYRLFVVTTFNQPNHQVRLVIIELLLLDVKMPNINGFELYREIRKRDDKVKICFLTAFEHIIMTNLKKYSLNKMQDVLLINQFQYMVWPRE